MIKRVVQTGAKTQEGGFHDGLLIIKYHVLTAGPVKKIREILQSEG